MERFYESYYFLVSNHFDYPDFTWEFRKFIFEPVFLYTLLVSGIIAAIYYNLIGNLTVKFGYKLYWFLFMVLSGLAAYGIAFSKITKIIYVDVGVQSLGWTFVFMNVFWAMVWYFIWSMILKKKQISTFANSQPFTTGGW